MLPPLVTCIDCYSTMMCYTLNLVFGHICLHMLTMCIVILNNSTGSYSGITSPVGNGTSASRPEGSWAPIPCSYF